MEAIEIDMGRIRKALPDRANVTLIKEFRYYHSKTPCIRILISPSISDQEFEQVKKWHRDIIGDALSQFYTEETGHHWYIIFKRVPIEFINCSDEDVNSFSGMRLIENGKLAR